MGTNLAGGPVREHGTHARYVHGPDEHGTAGKPCRCAACTTANRETAAHRARQQAYGTWNPLVDAEPAREHLRMLARHGVGWRRAAQLAQVSSGSVSRLLYGGPGARPPSRRIRPDTLAKILAVQPSLDLLPAAVLVDATGTRRRVQALAALGWSRAKIARQAGADPRGFAQVIHRAQVHAATARAVRDLYGELQHAGPPETTPGDRTAAVRIRAHAAANAWPPPAAWDGDIDQPAAKPHWEWVRSADGGDRKHRKHGTGADLAEDLRDLLGLGESKELAASRLGISTEYAERIMYRYPAGRRGEAA